MERIRRTMNELETDAQKVLQMEDILTRQWI